MSETKQCKKCQRILPKDNGHFNKSSTSKDGFYYICKECRGRKFTERKLTPKEGYTICSKCKRELPLDKYHFMIARDRKKGFRSQCKECEGTKFNEPVIKDGYKTCTKCGKRLKANKIFFQTRTRNKNQSNLTGWCKECYNEWHRGYTKKEKVKLKNLIAVQTRAAKKRKLISTLTKTEWEECLKFFNYKDAYTGLPMKIISQDHVIPLSKGGAYVKQNIIPCDASVNSSKHNYDMETWYKSQPFYNKQRLNKIYEWMGIKDNKQQLSII